MSTSIVDQFGDNEAGAPAANRVEQHRLVNSKKQVDPVMARFGWRGHGAAELSYLIGKINGAFLVRRSKNTMCFRGAVEMFDHLVERRLRFLAGGVAGHFKGKRDCTRVLITDPMKKLGYVEKGLFALTLGGEQPLDHDNLLEHKVRPIAYSAKCSCRESDGQVNRR
jgi:hypothetical protein